MFNSGLFLVKIADLPTCNAAVMQRTLAISEVATNICSHLDAPSLASMAIVSKILHEPAVRTLWADLPDLVPLVMNFPDDAWETQGYQIVSNEVQLLWRVVEFTSVTS